MEPSLREQEQVRRAGRGVPTFPARTLTSSETLRESDAFVLVDTTGGNVTVTLPKAAYMKGRVLWIKKLVAANTLTIEPDGTETVDDALNMAVTTGYACYTLLCDGTEWWIV